jgi:uncharacterized protein YeaO (DUF488 family)
MVRMKRVYEPAEEDDGYRVLAERLWPRGLSKDKARLDAWEKDIAPSADLRRWYGHDPAKWDEFQTRYEKELMTSEAQEILGSLAERARRQTVTLLYASHAADISNTAVLLGLLTKHPAAHGSEN